MHDEEESESFEAFKNSFSYGSRCDLNFKFLKALSAAEAATFLQELLWKLGDSLDDGDTGRLIDHVRAGQALGYRGTVPRWSYDEGPFTMLEKPLSASRLALLTSSGHFVAGQDPQPFGVEDMSQEEAMARVIAFARAAPELSEIALDTPPDQLRVRHAGYDIRGAQADPNVAFPLTRLRELAQEGVVGAPVDPAYSFVGVTAQSPLLRDEGPKWVQRLQEKGADGVILVPV
jgi:D-proline reductase (dithiol) PrdB